VARQIQRPMRLTFDVIQPSELEAGTTGFTERITVVVDSGDPGGNSGEFERELCGFLREWYDGAKIKRDESGRR
jgi:hypothetical protein